MSTDDRRWPHGSTTRFYIRPIRDRFAVAQKSDGMIVRSSAPDVNGRNAHLHPSVESALAGAEALERDERLPRAIEEWADADVNGRTDRHGAPLSSGRPYGAVPFPHRITDTTTFPGHTIAVELNGRFDYDVLWQDTDGRYSQIGGVGLPVRSIRAGWSAFVYRNPVELRVDGAHASFAGEYRTCLAAAREVGRRHHLSTRR